MFSKEAEAIVNKKQRKIEKQERKSLKKSNKNIETDNAPKKSKKLWLGMVALLIVIPLVVMLVLFLMPGASTSKAYELINVTFNQEEYDKYIDNSNSLSTQLQTVSGQQNFKNRMNAYNYLNESLISVNTFCKRHIIFAVSSDSYNSNVSMLEKAVKNLNKIVKKANDYYSTIITEQINDYWLTTYSGEYLKLYKEFISCYADYNYYISQIFKNNVKEGIFVNAYSGNFMDIQSQYVKFIVELDALKDVDINKVLDHSIKYKAFVNATLFKGFEDYITNDDTRTFSENITKLSHAKAGENSVTLQMIFPCMIDENLKNQLLSSITTNLAYVDSVIKFIGGQA